MKTLELIGTIKRIPISRERTGGRTRAEKPVSELRAQILYLCCILAQCYTCLALLLALRAGSSVENAILLWEKTKLGEYPQANTLSEHCCLGLLVSSV